MKKKKKPNLWPDVSILVVAVLTITAFFRGKWQLGLLIAAFAVWGVYAVFRHLLPFIREQLYRKEARDLRRHYEERRIKQQVLSDVDVSDPVSVVLLRHANHRISASLKAVYPDATWEWCTSDPAKVVAKGGVGRIRLHGVPEYNYAEVATDQEASIHFQLLKVVPFGEEESPAGNEQPVQKPKRIREVDPQVWYEQKGRTVLTNLIADLNSRGHSSLTILDDGNISIMQAEKEIKKAAFESVPERTCWPRLIKVFEREGIAADATDQGLVLSW